MLTDIEIYKRYICREPDAIPHGHRLTCNFYEKHYTNILSYERFQALLDANDANPEHFLFFCYFWKTIINYFPDKDYPLKTSIAKAKTKLTVLAKEHVSVSPNFCLLNNNLLEFIRKITCTGDLPFLSKTVNNLKKLDKTDLIDTATFVFLLEKPIGKKISTLFFELKPILVEHYFPLIEAIETKACVNPGELVRKKASAAPFSALTILSHYSRANSLVFCVTRKPAFIFVYFVENEKIVFKHEYDLVEWGFKPEQAIMDAETETLYLFGYIDKQPTLMIYNPTKSAPIQKINLPAHCFLYCTLDNELWLFSENGKISKLSKMATDTFLTVPLPAPPISPPMKIYHVSQGEDNSFHVIGCCDNRFSHQNYTAMETKIEHHQLPSWLTKAVEKKFNDKSNSINCHLNHEPRRIFILPFTGGSITISSLIPLGKVTYWILIDSNRLLAACADKQLKLLHLETKAIIHIWELPAVIDYFTYCESTLVIYFMLDNKLQVKSIR